MKKITLIGAKLRLYASCMVLMTGSVSFAQQIYSNGGISTGTNHSVSGAAPAGYTWSEMQGTNTSLGVSGFYQNAGAPPPDFSIADDFVVPAGEIWNLTSLDVFAYQTNHSTSVVPFDVLRVRIWNGDPALPASTVVFGDMTTNRINVAQSAEAMVKRTAASAGGTTRRVFRFRADVSVSLPAGTYWVEYQGHATNDGTMFFPPLTVTGMASNPTWNAKQRNSTTWGAIVDGGSSNALGLPFNLNGNKTLSNNEYLSSKISLYPNPAKNNINISNGLNTIISNVEIMDLKGRVVKSQILNSTEGTISISDLSAGVYMLNISSDQGIITKKIVKQ